MAIVIPCVLLILILFAYAHEIPQTSSENERSETITPFPEDEPVNLRQRAS